MSAANQILLKRRDFLKAWKMPPDIIVMSEDDFNEVTHRVGFVGTGLLFMGMEVEFGKETKLKFKTNLVAI